MHDDATSPRHLRDVMTDEDIATLVKTLLSLTGEYVEGRACAIIKGWPIQRRTEAK